MKNYNKLTSLAAAAFLLAGTSLSAQIVFDPVPTTGSVDRTIGSGITVTGTNMGITPPSAGAAPNLDPTDAYLITKGNDPGGDDPSWGGNNALYQHSGDFASGSITYAAPTGFYFTDFAAQVVTHNSIGENWATQASNRFTFESSTNGVDFSSFTMSGAHANYGGAGVADWDHFFLTTTALSALTDVTHLRITMAEPTDGEHWKQQTASATLTVVPEPSAFGLIAGFFGLTWVMLNRRSARS